MCTYIATTYTRAYKSTILAEITKYAKYSQFNDLLRISHIDSRTNFLKIDEFDNSKV